MNDVLSIYFQFKHSSVGHYLLPAFTIMEFSFLSYFFILIFSKPKVKTIIKIIWLSFTSFACIDYFILNKLESLDSFTIGIESMLIILFAIYFLYINLKDSVNFSIYSTFNFWIVITLLLYFAGTFFIYLLVESNRYNVEFRKIYVILNSSFNIIKNILFTIAICMKIKPTILDTSKPNIDLDDDFIINRTP